MLRFIMQAFIFCLFMVWTALFGLIFYLAWPDVTDAVIVRQQHRLESLRHEPTPTLTPRPCVPIPPQKKPTPSPTPTSVDDGEEEFIPLTEDAPPVHLNIKGSEELPKTEELKNELSRQSFEDRLIRILVKVNIAACTECTKDDKRILLQLKMMHAFLNGNVALATKYSKELDSYVQSKKKAEIKIKPEKKKE